MVGRIPLFLRLLLSAGLGAGIDGAAVYDFGGEEVKAMLVKAPGTIAYAIDAYQREMDRARAEKARKELLKLDSEPMETN